LLQLLQQQKLEQEGGVLNAIHISAVYYKLGQLCQRDDTVAKAAAAQQLLQLLDQLLPAVQQQLLSMPRELSNIVWACAYAHHPVGMQLPLQLFLRPQVLSEANAFDIANVMWALGDRELQLDSQQLQQLLDAYTSQLHTAIPQGIANVLCGVAKLQQQMRPDQLQLMVTTLLQQLRQADLRAISNSVWAVGKMGQQLPEQQLRLLLDGLVSKLHQATPQGVSNTLLGVAYMGQKVPAQQLQLILEALVKVLQFADPQAVSNSLWACARFRHVPGQVLAALQEQRHFERFLSDANPQDLATTAWACGQLGYSSSILLEGIMQQAAMLLQQHCNSFVTQDYCNLCWAVAVLDKQKHTPFVLQLTQACSGMWDTVETEGLRQLHQVHIWLQQLQSREQPQGLAGVLSKQQFEGCAASWEQARCSNAAATASHLQQQVFAALQQLPSTMWQGELRMEALTPDGNFNIDIAAVTAAGVQLAIEVDGPNHYVSPGRKVDGPTQFRNRMLAAQGYTVISVPYWEWDACKTAERQRQYLLDRLAGETLHYI
jgi:very-short-patch-repair endonuclease